MIKGKTNNSVFQKILVFKIYDFYVTAAYNVCTYMYKNVISGKKV